MAAKGTKRCPRKTENSKDKRTIRTKKSLREALFRLLEEKDISQITVTEIVKEADINRSTFYFYYDDIDDMLNKTEKEFIEIFKKDVVTTDKTFDNIDDYVTYLRKYLVFCKSNSTICEFLIHHKFFSNDNDEIVEDFTDIIRDEIHSVIPNTATIYDKNDPRSYLTTYALSAILNTILKWIDDGMVVDIDKMAEFLAKTYVMGANTIKKITY